MAAPFSAIYASNSSIEPFFSTSVFKRGVTLSSSAAASTSGAEPLGASTVSPRKLWPSGSQGRVGVEYSPTMVYSRSVPRRFSSARGIQCV